MPSEAVGRRPEGWGQAGVASANGRPTGAPAIDGLAAGRVLHPGSAAQVADALADAVSQGLAVAPLGGGTALALGNVPDRLDLALSTAALGDVIAYEPGDLVLSVGAGARLADVQALLAEHGQELPFEAPRGDRATIGGLVATAIAGPRRLANGTLRDLLIGIAVAHPSGTVTRAGGMVVKNVTGFDLPRLYHGSLGTLGVIVSANFKVVPAPRHEATVLAVTPDLAAALAAAKSVGGLASRSGALEVMLDGEGWTVAARFFGRPGTVDSAVAAAKGVLGEGTRRLEGAASTAWWRRYVDGQAIEVGPDEVMVRAAVRPRDSGSLAEAILGVIGEHGVTSRAVSVSPGLGTVVARLGFPQAPDGAPALRRVQRALLGVADHVTILAAPPGWKAGLDVWGEPPATLDVMRALKSQFDPERTLNRGRFAGHI